MVRYDLERAWAVRKPEYSEDVRCIRLNSGRDELRGRCAGRTHQDFPVHGSQLKVQINRRCRGELSLESQRIRLGGDQHVIPRDAFKLRVAPRGARAGRGGRLARQQCSCPRFRKDGISDRCRRVRRAIRILRTGPDRRACKRVCKHFRVEAEHLRHRVVEFNAFRGGCLSESERLVVDKRVPVRVCVTNCYGRVRDADDLEFERFVESRVCREGTACIC